MVVRRDDTLESIEFWYEFASPYSYLAAMQIDEVAGDKGVGVEWKPFLLGPIFKQQGLDTSPFNIFKTKGAYMWRDVERVCNEMSLSFRQPMKFPQNGLLAARLAMCAEVKMKRAEFSRAIFSLQFGSGEEISDANKVGDVLDVLGLDRAKAFEQCQSERVKLALRKQTERAAEMGVFGAPMFITPDGEMFWGNDRLEQAIAWTAA